MRSRSFLLIACVAACVGLASAAPQQAPPAAPVFHAGTNLARIDVRVTDGSGQAVTDLKPEEIEVLESGTRRPILLFQRIVESGRSYVESGARTIGSEVSTNQGSPRGQLYLLLFDQMHITPGLEQRARLAAETFLRKRLRPEDRVAIYGLPGPGPALAFTSSASTAREALQRVRGQMERISSTPIGDMTQYQAYEIARGNETEIARQVSSISQHLPELAASANDAIGRNATASPVAVRQVLMDAAREVVNKTDGESRRFLGLAARVLREARAIDGQKTVILFSEGFYADTLAHELKDVAAAAASSYAVVYAFDLNHSAGTLGASSVSAPQSSETASRLEPLSHLANETNGGLVVDALSHIDAAFSRLAETNADFYMVGFSPSEDADVSDYRRVEIRVTRPGARVSTRSGYVVNVPASSADRKRAIDDALTAPFGQQALRVEYTTYLSRLDPSDAARVALSLETELPVAAAGTTDAADVVFVVRDAGTGKTAASGSDRIPLPTAALPGLAVGRGVWRVQFALPPGSYFMRCVVREPGGLVGSADRRFEVRSLSGPDVAASDLIVGRANAPLPVRARGYTASPFSGAIRVYAERREDLAAISATLELVPADGGPAALTVRGVAGEVHATPAGASREVTFTLPLEGVVPGDYVARAIVRDATSTIADLRRQVDVAAGAEPAGTAAPSESLSGAPLAAITAARRPEDVAGGLVARDVIDRAAQSNTAAVRTAAGLAKAGKWPETVTTLAGVTPSDENGAALRGVALLAQRRFQEAADALAAGAAPGDGARAFVLGWARIGTGDRAGAIEAFRTAAAATPSMVSAHLALAETLLVQGDKTGAESALETGLRAIPGSPELTDMLGRIRR